MVFIASSVMILLSTNLSLASETLCKIDQNETNKTKGTKIKTIIDTSLDKFNQDYQNYCKNLKANRIKEFFANQDNVERFGTTVSVLLFLYRPSEAQKWRGILKDALPLIAGVAAKEWLKQKPFCDDEFPKELASNIKKIHKK